MKKFIVIALLVNYLVAAGQNALNLVPMPAEIKIGKGEFIFKKPIGFIVNDAFEVGDGGTDNFQKYLKKNFGFAKFIDGDTHSYGLPSEIFLSINNKRKEKYSTNEEHRKKLIQMVSIYKHNKVIM